MSVPVPSASGPAVPARVLAVRLGAIGDVANALVFATALKDARADVHLGWVVHPLAAPLVEGHPSVDRVHLWRRDGGLFEFARLVLDLRAERYDLAVDLQRIQKSALLARFSGAPRVLGFERAHTKEASWLWTRERVALPGSCAHMVERYLHVARHLGALRGPRHLLPHDELAEGWAEDWLAEFGAAPVVLNLGASKPANRWEPERFGRLARALVDELDLSVCFVGGPEDRPAAERAGAVAGAAVHDFVGDTSLLQLVALLRRAQLFIGCDTGPMHLAAAVRCPVLALFGPADPARTGPFGAGHVVLREPPPCAPCNRKTCNQPRHACMEDLTVERVLAAVHARLAAASLRPAEAPLGPGAG